MRVKFSINIGKPHAESLGLQVADCTAGKVAEVTDTAGQRLVSNGWAEALPEVKAVAQEPKLKAVPPEQTKPEPSSAKASEHPPIKGK